LSENQSKYWKKKHLKNERFIHSRDQWKEMHLKKPFFLALTFCVFSVSVKNRYFHSQNDFMELTWSLRDFCGSLKINWEENRFNNRMERILFNAFFSSRSQKRMHSHWIPIENKIKVNMLAIPEKPLNFQISQKWRHRQTMR
jgi:hypothetical protein